jgi:K+ transporter
VAQRPGGDPGTGWSAMRPVLVAFLLVADAFAVATLVVVRPGGWLPPLIGFGTVLVGLVWFEAWALRHRHDDD